jgi:glucans biosynthesis protein C
VGALLLRSLVVLIDWKGGLRAWFDGVVAALVRFPLTAVVLAAPVAAVLYFTKPWLMWFGVPTPDTGLIPNTPALVAFGVAFAFGWLLNRQPDIMNVWRRRWWLNLAIAIGLTAACLAILGPKPVIVPAAQDQTRLLYVALYTVGAWSWVFAIAGFALQFLAGENRTVRYLADSSYWLYIAHLPLVMALQIVVSQLDWPWYAKFTAVVAAAYTLLLLSYQLLVRYTFVGAILNGRRTRRGEA